MRNFIPVLTFSQFVYPVVFNSDLNPAPVSDGKNCEKMSRFKT
jgi:hypothetical protein